MAERRRAFVLIPFDDEFADVYSGLISKALTSADYEVERADSRLDQQNILRDIVGGIHRADLIVADLTSLNPNVFYELGVAHGLRIPTIMISQVVDEVPFDLRSYRVEEYSTHFSRAEEIVARLQQIGKAHCDGKVKFGSPVIDFLALEGVQHAREGQLPTAETEVAEGEGGEGPGAVDAEADAEADEALLDALVQGEEASQRLTEIMTRIAVATEKVGKDVEGHTEQINAINANPPPDAAKRLHLIAVRTAADLDSYANALEADLPDLEASSESMIEGFSQYVDMLRVAEEVDEERRLEVRSSIDELLDTIRGNLQSLIEYRESIESLRGYSRAINSASRRVTSALSRLITVVEDIEAYCGRALSLLDAAPEADR